MKKILIISGIAFLFLAFRKKKTVPKKRTSMVLISQLNAPVGTKQVYSKIGTKVYNMNNQVIFTYDFQGSGMTVTGERLYTYSVVIGDSFMNGISGFVNKNDVIV